MTDNPSVYRPKIKDGHFQAPAVYTATTGIRLYNILFLQMLQNKQV